jgi:hypothetical protein
VAGNLRRQAGHRHHRPGEIGVLLRPDEAVHAAHRRAHQQAETADAEPLHQHPPLRLHHVVIAILRKLHAEAVAGLRRFAVADIVRKDHVIAAYVERLTGAEQLLGELGLQELAAAAAGAVEHHHRIDDAARFVAPRRSQGRIMHPQRRQLLAGLEAEVAKRDIPLFQTIGIARLRCERRRGEKRGGGKSEQFHRHPPTSAFASGPARRRKRRSREGAATRSGVRQESW